MDCFNDVTGSNATNEILWDVQSKGYKSISPKKIGQFMITLYNNYLSDIEFAHYILFVKVIDDNYIINTKLKNFGFDNFKQPIQEKIKNGLLEKYKSERGNDIDPNNLRDFLDKVQIVISSQSKIDYIKNVTAFKNDKLNDKFYEEIFEEIRGAQSNLKIKNIEGKKPKALLEKNEISNKKRKVLFIASTGGHLNELMQIKPLFKKFDYHIVTEKTKVDDSFKEEYGDKISFLIYGTKKYPFTYIFKFLANCFISLYYFFRHQPEVVVTTGTHTAVPMCYIAKLFGSKVIFIETFANRTTGTVAGRLVYPIADTFVVQWEEMHKVYPKSVCWGWIY